MSIVETSLAPLRVAPAAPPRAAYDAVERALATCLAALADLATTAGQPDRVARLRDAAEALSAAARSDGSPGVGRPAPDPLANRDSTTQRFDQRRIGQPVERLTAREHEVALLIARGLTNRQIGEELIISERTADTHVQNILSKLGLVTRAQVAAWVIARQPF